MKERLEYHLPWIITLILAGVGGVAYVHSNFVSQREFTRLQDFMIRMEQKIDRLIYLERKDINEK